MTDEKTVQNPFGNNLDEEGAMPMGVISEAAPQKRATMADVLKRYKKRVWIILEDSDQIPPTGQFFGHDGVGFILRAGEAANVPVELLDILNNAIYDAPIVDPLTKQIIGYRPRLRFAYRIVPAPPPKEDAAA
jgi:hypothetical protein